VDELEVVVLTRDEPEYGLRKGDVGTIVLVHPGEGYEVEFGTYGGETVAVLTLPAQAVRAPGPREIAHVREVPGD
jgi:hypothetical protein